MSTVIPSALQLTSTADLGGSKNKVEKANVQVLLASYSQSLLQIESLTKALTKSQDKCKTMADRLQRIEMKEAKKSKKATAKETAQQMEITQLNAQIVAINHEKEALQREIREHQEKQKMEDLLNRHKTEEELAVIRKRNEQIIEEERIASYQNSRERAAMFRNMTENRNRVVEDADWTTQMKLREMEELRREQEAHLRKKYKAPKDYDKKSKD
jgi:hypothetical protein